MTQTDRVSDKPASRATRYLVKVVDEPAFTVLVHRGSVPREKIGTMVALHEVVEYICKEERCL